MASRKTGSKKGAAEAGVWNRGTGHGPQNPIRVRSKRLDEIDADKLALAYWLLAKQKVEDATGLNISEEEAKRVADQLDDSSPNNRAGRKRAA